MTNRKEPDTTEREADKSPTPDDPPGETPATHQEASVTSSVNSLHPTIQDRPQKPELSREHTALKPESDSLDPKQSSAAANDHVEPTGSQESTADDNAANNADCDGFTTPAEGRDDTEQCLTSGLEPGAACSNDTIDSGIYRSSRSLERSGSVFEREDTVPELHHHNSRLGGDYNGDYRRPSSSTIDSLSDSEMEENYLGNIPAHKRRSGVFVCQIQDANGIARNSTEEDCDSYIGVKRVKQDALSTDDYDSDADSRSMTFGVKRVPHVKSDQHSGCEAARPNRWSLGSADSLGSKSECSVTFSSSLATHVRKDSIAMGLEKMRPSQTFRRRSSVTFADLEELINKAKASVYMCVVLECSSCTE